MTPHPAPSEESKCMVAESEAPALLRRVEDAPSARKRVLLIAFDFPPRRTSGVYRPTALVKYLPRYGWDATVLTIHDPMAVEDIGLLDKLPTNIEVVRTQYVKITGLEDTIYRGLRSLGFLGTTIDPTSPRERTNANGAIARVASPQGTLRRVAAAARSTFYFPDETAGWIPFAAAAALRLVRRERFDAVYTTHPPRSAHIIGLLLKKVCGLPWVAEFRDPWVLPEHERPIFASQISAPRRNRWLHRKLLRHADGIVTVTSRHARELETYFHARRDKLAVVTNGFDEDDFRDLDTAPPSRFYDAEHVHLAHMGTVYPGFSGRFFQALEELIQEEPELGTQLRVHVIGYPDETVHQYAESTLRSIVQIHGFVHHTEALTAMRDCDALLLFYGHDYTSRASVPGKLYEYLRMGRPILALARPGGVDDLIRESAAGWVLRPDDVPAIKQTFKTIVASCRSGQPLPKPDAGVIAQYRYDLLTQRVANVLSTVARH